MSSAADRDYDVLSFGQSLQKESKLLLYVQGFLLLLCVFAPALYLVAPTQDQLRAFRYGLNVQSDWELCRANTRDFYLQTGRPLVPFTECVEHLYTWSLGDLNLSRWLAIMIMAVFFCQVYRTVLARTNHVVWAIINGLILVGLPGLQIFILQGGPALILLAGFPLSWWAVEHFVKIAERQPQTPWREWRALSQLSLVYAAIFFTYPVLAFVGFWYFAFAALYSENRERLRAIAWQALWLALYIGVLAVLYMIIVKLTVNLVYEPGRLIPLGENYSLKPNFSLLLQKLLRLFSVWWQRASFLWDQTHEIPLHLLSMFLMAGFIYISIREWINSKSKLFFEKWLFCICLVVVAQAVWLISSNTLEPNRYFIHLFAINSLFFLWLMWTLLQVFVNQVRREFLMRMLMLSAIVILARSVTMEMTNAMIEVASVRSVLYDRYQQFGLRAFRHIHFVKPNESGSYVGSGCLAKEVLCSPLSQHPEHSGQLVTALLREFLPTTDVARLKFSSCQEDLQCVQKNVGEEMSVVVSIAKDSEVDFLSSASVVLNMNTLVHRGQARHKFHMP